jgi:hypothetical protein
MPGEFVHPNVELGAAGGLLLEVAAATLTAQFTTLAATAPTTNAISYSYRCPSGANPLANGNGLVLWQDQEAVFDGTPLLTGPVPATSSSGQPAWPVDLQSDYYVVAYCTDGTPTTTVATAEIMPDGSAGEQLTSTVSIKVISTGSVIVDYSFPPGYWPKSFGNRLGLYEGQQGAFHLPPGLITPFPGDDNIGSVAINKPLLRSTWYTIVYFAGARPQDAAGFLRFQTA